MGSYIDILDPKGISGRSSLNCQKFPDVQRESCSAMKLPFRQEFKLDSIELFIEELAPHPAPPLLFRQESGPLSKSTCVSPVELTDGGGGGGGAKSYDSEKAVVLNKSFNTFLLKYCYIQVVEFLTIKRRKSLFYSFEAWLVLPAYTVLYKLHKLTPVIFCRIYLTERCSFPQFVDYFGQTFKLSLIPCGREVEVFLRKT
jgi:hypothetical protein